MRHGILKFRRSPGACSKICFLIGRRKVFVPSAPTLDEETNLHGNTAAAFTLGARFLVRLYLEETQ